MMNESWLVDFEVGRKGWKTCDSVS